MDVYLERKVKPDGTVREYPTELLHLGRGFALVRFRMQLGGGPPDIPVAVPPGSVSLGYFWARRPYNLYRWRGPDGGLLAHRFDAVADVAIGPGGVSYRDLALDWWVLPGDVLLEEDRDEFEALAAAGALTPRDRAAALAADREVHARYRHILDEAAQLEARYAAPGPA
ncbi:DUF402 domain-containing protein [Tepidiforma sp.]|jgi:hypothetical protein|uniref:DUF402 domain-containing protein n=1 Tax=Tepidiforma sp. TaxID=2682230 RepID=UPI00263383FD|nr:DUF402 domain-containing protein [Tepidiforma sp.]MCX7617105.1 DUF402 domain-containing protein [Tepidiforma sp.]